MHAGSTKTGSTSIQNYLDANREKLAKNGYLFPETGFTRRDPYDVERTAGHKSFFDCVLKGDDSAFIAECKRFYNDLNSVEEGCIILSAEELFHSGRTGLVRALSSYLEGVELELVFVLRNPLDWLLSRYRDLISGGWAAETRSFDTFVRDAVSDQRVDYSYWLDIFSMRFPDAKFKVLCYELLSENGAFLQDFLAELGIDSSQYSNPTLRSNKTRAVGIGYEAMRRIGVFVDAGNREVRQRWRIACFKAFEGRLSEAEARWKPTLLPETREFLKPHLERVNQQLAAFFCGGGQPGYSLKTDENEYSAPVGEGRITALGDIALELFEEEMQSEDVSLEELPSYSCLTHSGCLAARALRGAVGNKRVIAVFDSAEIAITIATLSGRLIYAVGLSDEDRSKVQMFHDLRDLISPIVCMSLQEFWDLSQALPDEFPMPELMVKTREASTSETAEHSLSYNVPVLNWGP